MQHDSTDKSQPAEVFIRWLEQVMFFVVLLMLCSWLQRQGLLHVRYTLTTAAILQAALWIPTYLHLRVKMLVLSPRCQLAIGGMLLLAFFIQHRFVSIAGVLGEVVTVVDIPLIGLGLVWWLLYRKHVERA